MKSFNRDGYSSRQISCILLSLFLVSAGLKLGIAFMNEPINLDAVRYSNAAYLVSKGQFREGLATSQFMPLLPLLIYAVYVLVENWILAGQLVSALFLSLTVLPLFLLARTLFDTRIALWAAVAFALSPPLAAYGAQILREPPFLFFLTWAFYFAVQAFTRARAGDFALTGTFALLATFCRLEGLLLPVACGAWALISAWRNRKESLSVLRGALILAFPFLLVLALAVAGNLSFLRFDYVSSLVGEFFSGDGWRGFFTARQSLFELEKAVPGGQWDNDFAQTARQFLPLIYFLGLLDGTLDVLFHPFGFLVILAIARVRKPGLGFIYLFLALYFSAALMFLLRNNMISDRYLLATLVPLFPLVGAGFQYLIERIGPSRKIAHLVLLVLYIFLPLAGSLRQIDPGDPTIRIAGQWLAAQNIYNGTLVCNDERVPFYAGLWREGYLRYPMRDFSGMGALAQQEGIDLMVVRVSERKRHDVALPDGFEILKEFSGPKDAVILFRRIQPPASSAAS